ERVPWGRQDADRAPPRKGDGMTDDTIELGEEIPFELPVEYTSEELVALADLLGEPRFPGLGEPVLPNLSEDARSAVLESAGLSLRAHGIVDDINGELALAPPHSAVLALVFAPGLSVLAQRVDAGNV